MRCIPSDPSNPSIPEALRLVVVCISIYASTPRLFLDGVPAFDLISHLIF